MQIGSHVDFQRAHPVPILPQSHHHHPPHTLFSAASFPRLLRLECRDLTGPAMGSDDTVEGDGPSRSRPSPWSRCPGMNGGGRGGEHYLGRWYATTRTDVTYPTLHSPPLLLHPSSHPHLPSFRLIRRSRCPGSCPRTWLCYLSALLVGVPEQYSAHGADAWEDTNTTSFVTAFIDAVPDPAMISQLPQVAIANLSSSQPERRLAAGTTSAPQPR